MKLLLIFISLFFLTSTGKTVASDFDSLTSKGIKEIYNIKFSEAETTFRKLMADYPESPAGRFFLAMIDWWKILIDLDYEGYDDIFYQKLEDVIFQCDQILDKDDKNVDALFFKGGAIGFRGRLRALRESWLKAADDGRTALPIVQYASKLDPGNRDVELGFGIYDYYASVIPDRYPLIKPLMIFFPKGNKEKGIGHLMNTANYGKYANFEAQYFLMTLYYQYENNFTKAAEYSQELYEKFPDNPIFERWRGRIAVRMGQTYIADTVFQKVYFKCAQRYAGYYEKSEREAVYYLGVFAKDSYQLDTAKFYLQRTLELSEKIDKKETSGFLVNAVLYLGMINDELGNREKALEYYHRVLDLRDFASSRKQAEQYIQNPYKRF
ncbi:MAG: tetratricopeptide repeat protein [Ignavibacteriales bacterium]|nr:tetratricopeptide repeat protein [Ignavibacteriales bacterium]HPO55418.1 tetratricopeptide repeat protein [Ignavibacteriaceae bacterium]